MKALGERKGIDESTMDKFTPLLSVTLVLIAVFFFAYASSQNEPNYGVKELALVTTTNIGGYQFLVRDLSSNAVIITVSKDGSIIDPLLLISRGEKRSIGTMELGVQEIIFTNGIPSAARISFSKTIPKPRAGAIGEDKAKQNFLKLFPQYLPDSLSVTLGSCRKSPSFCYVVSGYRKFNVQNTAGSSLGFFDGTIAYIDSTTGMLVYAFKTN